MERQRGKRASCLKVYTRIDDEVTQTRSSSNPSSQERMSDVNTDFTSTTTMRRSMKRVSFARQLQQVHVFERNHGNSPMHHQADENCPVRPTDENAFHGLLHDPVKLVDGGDDMDISELGSSVVEDNRSLVFIPDEDVGRENVFEKSAFITDENFDGSEVEGGEIERQPLNPLNISTPPRLDSLPLAEMESSMFFLRTPEIRRFGNTHIQVKPAAMEFEDSAKLDDATAYESLRPNCSSRTQNITSSHEDSSRRRLTQVLNVSDAFNVQRPIVDSDMEISNRSDSIVNPLSVPHKPLTSTLVGSGQKSFSIHCSSDEENFSPVSIPKYQHDRKSRKSFFPDHDRASFLVTPLQISINTSSNLVPQKNPHLRMPENPFTLPGTETFFKQASKSVRRAKVPKFVLSQKDPDIIRDTAEEEAKSREKSRVDSERFIQEELEAFKKKVQEIKESIEVARKSSGKSSTRVIRGGALKKCWWTEKVGVPLRNPQATSWGSCKRYLDLTHSSKSAIQNFLMNPCNEIESFEMVLPEAKGYIVLELGEPFLAPQVGDAQTLHWDIRSISLRCAPSESVFDSMSSAVLTAAWNRHKNVWRQFKTTETWTLMMEKLSRWVYLTSFFFTDIDICSLQRPWTQLSFPTSNTIRLQAWCELDVCCEFFSEVEFDFSKQYPECKIRVNSVKCSVMPLDVIVSKRIANQMIDTFRSKGITGMMDVLIEQANKSHSSNAFDHVYACGAAEKAAMVDESKWNELVVRFL
ncbi:unnamed protein product [Notodromas monacha]|uniref:Uncharacterized protein n=1 Tax=Notodromas monacha TaxID=399045 RepID=A0A7R9BSY9_9CRUS|nr:unnamed protein product [Notodromas monacha]CAG0920113.1 unnamed protein product [Notodromas monacha]